MAWMAARVLAASARQAATRPDGDDDDEPVDMMVKEGVDHSLRKLNRTADELLFTYAFHVITSFI